MSKIEEEFASFFDSKCLAFVRNNKVLKGTPDFTFFNGKLALFIHGCFWHGHNCKSRNLDKVWQSKINNTIEKDFLVRQHFLKSNIQYFRIWECEYHAQKNYTLEKVYKEITLQLPHS